MDKTDRLPRVVRGPGSAAEPGLLKKSDVKSFFCSQPTRLRCTKCFAACHDPQLSSKAAPRPGQCPGRRHPKGARMQPQTTPLDGAYGDALLDADTARRVTAARVLLERARVRPRGDRARHGSRRAREARGDVDAGRARARGASGELRHQRSERVAAGSLPPISPCNGRFDDNGGSNPPGASRECGTGLPPVPMKCRRGGGRLTGWAPGRPAYAFPAECRRRYARVFVRFPQSCIEHQLAERFFE